MKNKKDIHLKRCNEMGKTNKKILLQNTKYLNAFKMHVGSWQYCQITDFVDCT